MLREATAADAAAIAAIYNQYVTDTIVTFEEEPVTADEIASRMAKVRGASLPWLVAEAEGKVVGYAYASPWAARVGYRFTVEITVYVHRDHSAKGLGSALYGALLPMLEARGIHSVIGGIALPNEASVALHEKCGLRKVAHYDEVGIKFGQWIAVGYWQRIFRPGDDPAPRRHP
jgi:phosphinothricin acetyltransferase